MPDRSLGRGGMRVVVGLVGGVSLLIGGVFLAVGAWPVLGFMGAEFALVVGLLALHRRRRARMVEALRLTGATLWIGRQDGAGRRVELALDPYWVRARLEPRAGQVSRLVLATHGREIEVGALLGEAEKRDLARALAAALAAYRAPRFDNPQLR